MPNYTYEEKMELKNQKLRKGTNKKESFTQKKTLLQKEAKSIDDIYEI